MKRVLVANRGEVALRIIRACRTLGIEAVAVYADADARAPHVTYADRAVPLGGANLLDTYLSTPALIAAARRSGADAIHPGYGFLSENATFADACGRAGLVFVGPPASVIAHMGSKVAARRTMERAGVPVVPGATPADQSDVGVETTALAIGLPVLIKASAGGGGKGMREVHDAGDLTEAIGAARREAEAAFGDGTLYVERLLSAARHVEVQVFGDEFDNVVHLFERECSVQRRHQKIVEESPSPTLFASVKTRLTQAAVTAARAVAYRNAGTIEFLVEGDGDAAVFYFLEMNTRLQVEHPVTEELLGVDVVAAQLEVAAGKPLPWRQEQLSPRGHTIEARVYAEDPDRDFLPQAGRIELYREPRVPGVRVDSGIVEGAEVSSTYDPLLAKVIATAETRTMAIARLADALRDFPLLGITTNVSFLLRVLGLEAFRAGTIDTSFIDRHAEILRPPASDADRLPVHVAAAVAAHHAARGSRTATGPAVTDPWSGPGRWRP